MNVPTLAALAEAKVSLACPASVQERAHVTRPVISTLFLLKQKHLRLPFTPAHRTPLLLV